MNTQDPKKAPKRHWIIRLLLAASLVGVFMSRMSPKKRKILSEGFQSFVKRGARVLVEYCVPHEWNEYKPKIFHHHSVRTILVLVVIVKVAVVTTMFTLYPNLARFNQDIRSAMYTLINEYRLETGVQPLKVNVYLESTAEQKGGDMLENNYFSHFGLDGKKPWEWLEPSRYTFAAMGENLAMDFLTAGSVLKAFQKSPSHDKNLLNGAYNEIGISVQNGFLDGHQTNLMVVFFATPKTQAATLATAPKPEARPAEQTVTPPKPTSTPPQPVTRPVAQAEQPAPVATTTPTSTVAAAEREFAVRPLSAVTGAEVLGQSTGNAQYVYAENLTGGSTFSQGSLLQSFIAWSDRFFAGFLIAAVLLLIINIIVKIRIQHASVIANALLLIAVLSVALYSNVHQAEALGEQVRILSQFWQ